MRHLLRIIVQRPRAVHIIPRFATLTIVLLLATAFAAHADTTDSANPVSAATLPETIKDADVNTTEPSVKFLKDIAPILDKQGCSAGMCHGKFGGQGGLNLSLLTLNPESDHEPIVHHNRGRRINLLEPDQSLFYLKPTGQVPHEGGLRFDPNSDEGLTILRWIEAGAPFSDDEPRLRKLEIEPSSFVLSDIGHTSQLKVLAHFSNGSVEDVTEKAVYESKDAPVAEVSPTGEVTSVRWGGTAIIARFLGVVDAAFVTIPRASEIGSASQDPEFTPNNFIDEFVLAKLKKLNIRPSALTTDDAFMRRVYLDTIGRLPTPDEVKAFLADANPDKRSTLIDTLLDTQEWVNLRTLKLADMLRIHPRSLGNGAFGQRGATLFHEWVREAVAQNRPYDQIVEELITSRGSTYQHGPTNYYRIEQQPAGRAETTAQVFLGIRLSCARCHKHPFDQWTTDDYWNFAAFTGKVGIRGGGLYNEQVVYYNPTGRVINQSVQGNRGEVALPTFLGGESLAPNYQGDVLQVLADWMTSPTNPYFAKATVNRIWSHYFGRGIVDPVDDMRATTPPSVEGLLEALADDFVQSGFDTKHIIKRILNSRTYQLSAEPNETNRLDDRFFSRFYPRPMMAQVLLDVLNDVTETSEKYGRYPKGTRSVALPLPVSSRFLSLYGRSGREFLGDLDPKLEPTLTQALYMINSGDIQKKLRSSGGVIARLIKGSPDNGKLITELYLSTLSRFPTDEEFETAKFYIAESPKRRAGCEDLLWALISSRAFIFVQ
ncbi:S-layer protein [Candidatus Poribacteria bacterium]|nr:MAG: S-layer protein [Candidatus Poribacteria bacterium]